MDSIRLIFESDETIIINNDLVVHDFPFAMDWFTNADLIIQLANKLHPKFITQLTLNTNHLDKFPHTIYQITPKLFLIKLKTQQISNTLKVTHTSTHFIFPKRYTVEIAQNENSSFFTIFSKKHDKFAVCLDTIVQNPNISLQDNKIVLTDSNIHFVYCPAHNRVEKHLKKPFKHAPLQLMFLQHILFDEYSKARKLLSFDISETSLRNYFGNFEILLNNYLGDQNIVTIIKENKPQNLRFEIQNNMIINIQ
ncbi:MAG: hypothetical protein FWE16_03745 [Firmicutes bacterium]|nr:hypothetical protein [Bacillota bacterium]